MPLAPNGASAGPQAPQVGERGLISVVVPTYNRARDLDRALRSILAQTYTRWEALVVDNHSQDDTEDVVRRLADPRIRFYKIHNGGVIAASRNVGIRSARGEFVAFLDSDDWWSPQKLEVSFAALQNGADVVYHDLFSVTKPGQRLFWRKQRARDLQRPVFVDLLLNGNGVCNVSSVVRKTVLDAIGGQSEDRDLIGIEDYDGWLRIAKVTERFHRIPHTLGYYWSGGGNTTAPDRSLRTLGVLERRYADALRQIVRTGANYWFEYARGRACYLAGSFPLAKASLQRACERRPPFPIRLRCYWMLLRIMLFSRSFD